LGQTPSSVSYGYVSGNGLIDGPAGFDAGAGWRSLNGSGTVGYGVNATIGQGWSRDGNSALRGTLGVELFTGRIDSPVYGILTDTTEHVAGDEEAGAADGLGTVLLDGHRIFMSTPVAGGRYERAMNGFAGEAGYHLYGPDFGTDALLDLRLSAGAFY